jgi:hypothetical protein
MAELKSSCNHLAIRNPNLPFPHDSPWSNPNGRIGCWNTVILTACGILTQPDAPRYVTCRLDLVTCQNCRLWAENNKNMLEDDGLGHLVTA